MSNKCFGNEEEIGRLNSLIGGVRNTIVDENFLDFLDSSLHFFSEDILRKKSCKLVVDNEEISISYLNNEFKLCVFPRFQDIKCISLFVSNNAMQKQVKLKFDNEKGLYLLESTQIINNKDKSDVSSCIRKEELSVVLNGSVIYSKVFTSSIGFDFDDTPSLTSCEEKFVFPNGDVLRNYSATTFSVSSLTYTLNTKNFISKISDVEYYDLLDKFYNKVLDVREVTVLKKSMN